MNGPTGARRYGYLDGPRRVEAAFDRLKARQPGPAFESEVLEEVAADGGPPLSAEEYEAALEELGGDGRVNRLRSVEAFLDVFARGFGEVVAVGDLRRAEVLAAKAFEVAARGGARS